MHDACIYSGIYSRNRDMIEGAFFHAISYLCKSLPLELDPERASLLFSFVLIRELWSRCEDVSFFSAMLFSNKRASSGCPVTLRSLWSTRFCDVSLCKELFWVIEASGGNPVKLIQNTNAKEHILFHEGTIIKARTYELKWGWISELYNTTVYTYYMPV